MTTTDDVRPGGAAAGVLAWVTWQWTERGR